MPSVEVVLARYTEDVTWASRLGVPVTVYNKGEPLTGVRSPRVKEVPLPNVGREAHTYLMHMLDRHDSLADWTVFSQADPDPHLQGASFRDLLRPPEPRYMLVPWVVHMRDWGPDGRLRWQDWTVRPGEYGGWQMRRAPVSLVKFVKDMYNFELTIPSVLSYMPGAIFGIDRKAIETVPRSWFETALTFVSDHACPEEAFYFETTWSLLFGRQLYPLGLPATRSDAG